MSQSSCMSVARSSEASAGRDVFSLAQLRELREENRMFRTIGTELVMRVKDIVEDCRSERRARQAEVSSWQNQSNLIAIMAPDEKQPQIQKLISDCINKSSGPESALKPKLPAGYVEDQLRIRMNPPLQLLYDADDNEESGST